MIKANQRQIAHNTNITLVSIRSAEINYFSTYFAAFGTQSALIVGSVISATSSVTPVGEAMHPYWVYLYSAAMTISLIASIHSLLCSVFISVYGQGLALRGPVGSMVRAVNGMVIEQFNVLVSFVISIVAFAFGNIGMYYCMFNRKGAVICSSITLAGLVIWYHYCLRIYNRFKFDENQVDVKFHDDNDDVEEDDGIPKAFLEKAKNASSSNSVAFIGREEEDSTSRKSASKKKKKQINSFFKKLLAKAGNTKEFEMTDTSRSPIQLSEDILFSGILLTTLQEGSTETSTTFSRRYFALRTHLLYMYKDFDSFTSNPSKPMIRPKDVDNLFLDIPASETAPYPLVLRSKDNDNVKPLLLKCESLEDTSKWIDAFQLACQYSRDST